jgi:hypothetical protein
VGVSDLPPTNLWRHDDDADVARGLRLDVCAPDLTESILDRVSLHRTFLDRRGRRLVWATRCAIGASVLLLAGAIVFVHERYPQVRGEEPRPTPLSSVVATARDEAMRLRALRGGFEIPEGSSPSLGYTALTINAPGPIAAKQPDEVMPLTSAGPSRMVAVVPWPERMVPPAYVDAAPRDRVAPRDRLEFPSAAEAVHRWAMTADAPSAPRLLRSSGFDEAPLLQGPISDEIRLPR